MTEKYHSTSNKIPQIRKKKGINTIQDMLVECSSLYGENLAYSINRKNQVYNLTFSQVYELSTRFAYYLNSIGIENMDHVAILGNNSPEWAISYFAVNWIGAISVPLDARANANDINNILKHSDSKAIIYSDNFTKVLDQINEDLIKSEHRVSMNVINKDETSNYPRAEKINSSKKDVIDILFTSGTTGNPKGVMLTNENIMSNIEDIYTILEINPGDRAFSILPIHHSYERTCGLLATFYSGVHVFFARSIKPREMLFDLKTAKPTIWLNAPLILEKLYKRIQKELENQKGIKKIITKVIPKKLIGKKIKKQLGLENIRLIVCGGAALPLWVSKGLSEFGFPILQGYGLSETSPLISANPPSKPKNESVGLIINSDEVVINDIDSDGNGEITVKGPNVMKGYYKNKEATAEILSNDGWLRTGDTGYFDKEGYLYITGRKKSVIVTKGGKNIHPEEIEEKLTESNIIEEALVFSPDDVRIQAILHPSFEEIGLNSFHLTDEEKEDIWNLINKEIRNLNKKMESYKRISEFCLTLEELPKTTTRKIKRYMFKDVELSKNTKFIDI